MMKNYYTLVKPGIVYGNVLVAAAAFIFASRGSFSFSLFVLTLAGLSGIIAAACVFNNYFDRGIDTKMERTKTRGIPSGNVSGVHALIFGAILFCIGSFLLIYFVNLVAFSVALAGFVIYVGLYTPLKHKTGHALWVGAIAGATPPLVGYAAVAGMLDLVAWSFFAFLFIWQIPHFLAIAAYRYDEYAAAEVPLLIHNPTVRQKQAARKIFFGSLVVLLAWCGALVVI